MDGKRTDAGPSGTVRGRARGIGILAALAASLAALGWSIAHDRMRVAPTPASVAREELPGLLARLPREPSSADLRHRIVACYSLLGDRLGAWQHLCLAEPLGSSLDVVRTARVRAAEALGQWQDALATAERLSRAAPSDLGPALSLHRLRTLRGEFGPAHAAAVAALAHHPDDPEALAAAGEACFNLARYPEAIRYLEEAQRKAPDRPAIAVQLGVALLRAERSVEAVRVLEEVTRLPDPPPQTWEFLGQARFSLGHSAGAGESFRRAEAAAPSAGSAFGLALVALAQSRARKEDEGTRRTLEREAAAGLRLALERDPEHEAAATTLSQLLRASGRRAEAAATLGRFALAVGEAAVATPHLREATVRAQEEGLPACDRARYRRDVARACEAAEDGPAALDAIHRAEALTPNDPSLLRQHVETALAAFSPAEALRACDRYARVQESSAAVHWWRFRAYRQLQVEPRAAAALAAAAAASPDHPRFLTWQARLLLEGSPNAPQLTAAEQLLRRSLARRGNDQDTLESLAEVLVRQQAWEEAASILRRALALDPRRNRGRLWLQLARCDRALGRAPEAAWSLARYRELESRRTLLARRHAEAATRPGDGAALLAWATAALHDDRDREARTVARAAVRAAPGNAAAYEALAVACQRLGRLEDRIVAMEAAAACRTRR